MKTLATLEKKTPHNEAMGTYGYRFGAIDVYHVDWKTNLKVSDELSGSYACHDIALGENSPHLERIIWEIASHIEGNFGPPYTALIVCHAGRINIYTPKNDKWWNDERWSELSNYLMGLRSLLDLIK